MSMQIYEKQFVHVQIEIDYPHPVAGRTASKSFFKYKLSKQITFAFKIMFNLSQPAEKQRSLHATHLES